MFHPGFFQQDGLDFRRNGLILALVLNLILLVGLKWIDDCLGLLERLRLLKGLRLLERL